MPVFIQGLWPYAAIAATPDFVGGSFSALWAENVAASPAAVVCRHHPSAPVRARRFGGFAVGAPSLGKSFERGAHGRWQFEGLARGREAAVELVHARGGAVVSQAEFDGDLVAVRP